MTQVIEAEVVAQDDLLPARLDDVELRVAILRPMHARDQMIAVTNMIAESRFGLQVALAAQDLPGIVEYKAKGNAISEIVKQLQLGKDMQLDAAAFIRRTERGLGVAIREGQANKTIKSRGNAGGGIPTKGINGSAPRTSNPDFLDLRPTPADFAPRSELSGTDGTQGIYAMTDGVSDEAFDKAMDVSRDEGNLSRANVARHAREIAAAEPKPQPEPVPVPEPELVQEPEPPKKVRKTAAAQRVMEDLVVKMNSLAFIVGDTDPAEVDHTKHAGDIVQINASMRKIKQFLTAVKEQN